MLEGIEKAQDEFADEVLSKALIKAREVDAEEQADAEVEDMARLIQENGGVFVECPHPPPFSRWPVRRGRFG